MRESAISRAPTVLDLTTGQLRSSSRVLLKKCEDAV
jgi:hypothetical protein